MNKTIMIGNLTKDPDLRTTGNDTKVCNFSIAVQKTYDREKADFFNITAWRKTAENAAKYLKKGSKVAVFGRFENANYTKDDGTKVYRDSFTADEVEFLPSGGSNKQSNDEGVAPGAVEDQGDMPF